MVDISVLIPARDEESNIYSTLVTIKNSIPAGYTYEILIGNHVSTDGTLNEINRFYDQACALPVVPLKKLHIYTINPPTVAAVRNYLAERASGRWLLFLDADTQLTPAWRNAVKSVLTEDELHEYTAFSTVPIMGGAGWKLNFVRKHWFGYITGGRTDQLRQGQDRRHLSGAHILIHRALFDYCGWFDEGLVTGEDVDLTQRIKLRGGSVVVSPDFCVVHQDYPKTVKAFFKREVWHGKGDFKDWKSFSGSPVAVVSVLFAIQAMFFVCTAVLNPPLGLLSLALLLAIPLTMSFYKFTGLKLKQRLMNAFMCGVYLTARAFSCVTRST